MATRRTTSLVNDINVTPMVDVMLVLLIIFMVVTPMLQPHHTVKMAQVHNAQNMLDAGKDDAIVIAVTHDGRFFLGSDQTTAHELPSKVDDLIAARVNKNVYVKIDARAKYKDVTDVVNSIRSAGVSDIGLLAEKIEKQTVRK